MEVMYIIMTLIVGTILYLDGEAPERAFICGVFWPLWILGQLIE